MSDLGLLFNILNFFSNYMCWRSRYHWLCFLWHSISVIWSRYQDTSATKPSILFLEDKRINFKMRTLIYVEFIQIKPIDFPLYTYNSRLQTLTASRLS